MGRPRTLRAVLRDAARRLEAARVSYGHGTTNARDEAAWLVLHALRLDFEALEERLDQAVTPEECRAAAALVEERIRTRKPAAYLTHEAWLGPYRFYVDERVIVPRSYIAELLLDEQQRASITREPVRRALDLCTGSGCLAILAALIFRRCQVDAADISTEALEVASRNIVQYGLRRHVRLIRSDVFGELVRRRYDLIVANPPYVSEAAMRRLPKEYRKEPALALAGGRDGLDIVRRIVHDAPAHLTPNGVLVVEVGHHRGRVERAFPHLPLLWPETSGGDDCVFAIRRDALLAGLKPARSRRATQAAASLQPRVARSPARASNAGVARRRRNARE